MRIEKTIQVCNFLLKRNNSRMNYTKLIKLIYLADKKFLDYTEIPITGDTYVSMDNGPVLSGLYDLIREKYSNKYVQKDWNSCFKTDGYDLVIVDKNISNGELSPVIEEILTELDLKFKNYNYKEMIEYTHKNCPEWVNPNGSSKEIKMKDILKSLNRNKRQINYIIREQKIYEEEDRILAYL
jgi:uncharacterized phage-associated protein